jgi:ectoine hydroxylase-related dioxygenase (phytanoyl-CoA dioxygenase family)
MLSDIQKLDFERDGFLIVPDAVPQDLIDAMRAAAVVMAGAEPADVHRRTWHERALFRRPVFRKFLDASALFHAAADLIGDDIQLLALDLLLVRAGRGNIGWHRDVGFVSDKTLSMNTGIYLQDLTDAIGPLQVWPGSHRRTDWAPTNNHVADAIKVNAKAGSAVFFDAALWHSASPNTSNSDRLAIFPYFGKYWIKRMDAHFTQPLPAELLHTQDPMKRQLLGLGLRDGVASYHGDDPSYNRRGEAGIDFA